MGKRKQASGYQNRKRAREKLAAAQAAGTWMPPLPTVEEVSSLTAITATRHGAFCHWLEKRISTDDFAVVLRTLAEFRSDAMAEHLLTLPPASRVNTVPMMRQMRPAPAQELQRLAVALHEHGAESDLMESRAAFAEKRKPRFKGWNDPQDRFRPPTLDTLKE